MLTCFAGLQAQNKHEISLYGGSGLSTLNYDVTAGEQKSGFGGQFGVGYNFFFSPNWSLGTGMELGFYNAKFNLGRDASQSVSTAYTTTDTDGDTFEFRSTVSNYEEEQRAMLLQIPLMLQFQTGRKHQFYGTLGGKVGIPLNGKYESSATTIQNSGYYTEEDYEYTIQQFMGFGTFTDRDTDGDLKFKTAFFVSAEAGVKWKLNDKLSLYTGAYVDYGLNNIISPVKTGHSPSLSTQFIAYNAADPKDFAVNSIMKSQYTQNNVTQSFTDKITPIAAGIKIRLAFRIP